jgi:hypothetical protein
MKMNRKNPYGIVDVNNEIQGDVAYCRTCEKGGLMRQKLYEAEDPNFCICDRGHKFPIYEREEEGDYSFPFDIITNPFESGSQFESIGKRKPHDRLKDYKDKDI